MTEVALFILGCALGAPLGFSICALAAANGRKKLRELSADLNVNPRNAKRNEVILWLW